jgi:hypothetical protein
MEPATKNLNAKFDDLFHKIVELADGPKKITVNQPSESNLGPQFKTYAKFLSSPESKNHSFKYTRVGKLYDIGNFEQVLQPNVWNGQLKRKKSPQKILSMFRQASSSSESQEERDEMDILVI